MTIVSQTEYDSLMENECTELTAIFLMLILSCKQKMDA